MAHASGTWLEGKLLAGKEKLAATFDQQDVCTSLHLRYERGRPGVWVWDPAAFVALATGRVVTLRKGRDHELLSWREGPHLVSVEYGPEGIESLRIETR